MAATKDFRRSNRQGDLQEANAYLQHRGESIDQSKQKMIGMLGKMGAVVLKIESTSDKIALVGLVPVPPSPEVHSFVRRRWFRSNLFTFSLDDAFLL